MCRRLVFVPILFLLALSPCGAGNAGIRLELLLMRLVCALLPMVSGAVCRRLAAWSGQTGAVSGSCRHLAAPLMAGACTWGRAPVPALRSDARGAPAQVRAALRGRVPATPELRAPAAVCRWRAAHACRGAPTVSSGATVAPAPEWVSSMRPHHPVLPIIQHRCGTLAIRPFDKHIAWFLFCFTGISSSLAYTYASISSAGAAQILTQFHVFPRICAALRSIGGSPCDG